jgi:hypothetical protein
MCGKITNCAAPHTDNQLGDLIPSASADYQERRSRFFSVFLLPRSSFGKKSKKKMVRHNQSKTR